MTSAEKTQRAAKAQGLSVAPMADDIHRHENGALIAGRWLVTCESDPALRHQVRFEGRPTPQWSCSCQDWRRHREEDPFWVCKHILSVQKEELMPAQNRVPRATARAQKERLAIAQEKAPIGFLAPEPMTAIPLSPFAQRALEQMRAGTWTGQGTMAEVLPEEEPEADDPYSWTPEQISAYQAETERLRREAAELRAEGFRLRQRFKDDQEGVVAATPTLASIHAALTRPFPIALVEVKPGAIANGKALALAFVDSRAYQARLDEAAGPDQWSVEYRPLGDRAVICRLTILGVTREDVGEADPESENAATCMIAQSFKRACASFGLGRYLYSLPRVWAEMEGKKIKDPEGCIQQLYRGIK